MQLAASGPTQAGLPVCSIRRWLGEGFLRNNRERARGIPE
jgi:hypothetical protein